MKTEWLSALSLAVGSIIVGAAIIAGVAVLGGTIVWFLWPYAIPAAFPGLVTSGVLAAKLPWWSAVCLTWLCGILVKGTTKQTEKSKAKSEPKEVTPETQMKQMLRGK